MLNFRREYAAHHLYNRHASCRNMYHSPISHMPRKTHLKWDFWEIKRANKLALFCDTHLLF